MQEVYYYEGDPLPLEEVAVLDVRIPLGIMKRISPMSLTAAQEYYYSGKFALEPVHDLLDNALVLTTTICYC